MACSLDRHSAGKDRTNVFTCSYDLTESGKNIQQSNTLADFEHLRSEASYLDQKFRYNLVTLMDHVNS